MIGNPVVIARSRCMDTAIFNSMVASAKPGTIIEYFTGNLAIAAESEDDALPSDMAKWRAVRSAAMRAYRDGLVDLVQKPTDTPPMYRYLAIVRKNQRARRP